MELPKALTDLESSDELHEGRLLVLLLAFVRGKSDDTVGGLTKLAKLDFLLRYPTLLERLLAKRGKPTRAVDLQEHEAKSVESKMVRYRFGPWDHRYRRFLNLLVGKGLVSVSVDGRTVQIGLTESGVRHATQLAESGSYQDVARRAKLLKTHFDLTGTNLMKLVYETFPGKRMKS